MLPRTAMSKDSKMTRWVRYEHKNIQGFGTLEGDQITVHKGDMFANPLATDETTPLAEVKILTPTQPSKMPALAKTTEDRQIADTTLSRSYAL